MFLINGSDKEFGTSENTLKTFEHAFNTENTVLYAECLTQRARKDIRLENVKCLMQTTKGTANEINFTVTKKEINEEAVALFFDILHDSEKKPRMFCHCCQRRNFIED